MVDTYTRVKDSLVTLLQDQDNKVIALTGKWGTGKTYLWRNVAIEMFGKTEASKQPIYVSLFGIRTINDLKLRILQNAYSKNAKAVKGVLNAGGGILKDFIKWYAGVSIDNAALGVALIWFQALAKDNLIVIDDIERKHKSLDIDEFLGLLDEYSETHNTRFLILLNTDKLHDNREVWDKLHEKVIDAEIVLDPTVIETFDIAAKGNTAPHLHVARDAVVILNINNIRVIGRILKMMERVADATKKIDGVSAARWVPSTALLTAGHYRAIENAPPFEYMKSLNRFSHFLDDQKGIKRDPKELDWDLLLNKLDIQVIDAYEEILQQFLKSGLLDIERLKILFEGYKKEGVHADAFTKQNEFFKACWWDVRRSDDDLLTMARELLPFINVYGPDSITDIVSVIEKLGNVDLARQFLDSWLQSIETRPEYQNMDEVPFDISLRQYHPEVIKKMNEMRNKQHPPLTVIETAERIIDNSGWGERERYSLRNSTVQQYEEALIQVNGDKLRRFLYKNLEWAKNPPGDDSFKIAVDNFLAACFNVYSADPNSRLSKVIYRTFEGYGLSAKLDPVSTDSSPQE
jgi:hypothetical protein